MEFSEEWKTFWPISSSYNPPLLLRSNSSSSSPSLGPLFFNPIPNTTTPLFSPPSSLCPPVTPPPPSLSLSRFLQFATSPHCPILQSTSTVIASYLGTDHFRDFSAFDHNRLEQLRCPDNRIITFFPTGENLDRVGFVVLVPGDSGSFRVVLDGCGKAFVSANRFSHRIVRLSACPADCSFDFVGNVGSDQVGFLMSCTMYSVHWFSVRISGLGSGSEKKPVLDFLGCKQFKSCGVAHACWNPHFPEESAVLLESGELYLFDVNSAPTVFQLNSRFRGKRLSPSWEELGGYKENGWFSCGFSWHPRILIVANSNAVFLVDFRFDKCHLSCLLKIGILGYNTVVGADRFVAFSEAGPDRFYYTIATEHLLLLCDIRKPFNPRLQWLHGIRAPSYLVSLRLSELRSTSNHVTYRWASEEGFGILLGSFWNSDFVFFFYGPHPSSNKVPSSRVSNFGSLFYAWELPSRLLLASDDCFCGSCLLRLEFAKDDLPEWIPWQQKKELVLGFFIVDNSSLSTKPDDHRGFTVIRLMSSGKLEAQRYHASWDMLRVNGAAHEEVSLNPTVSLLFPMGDGKYKYQRKFKYLKLEHLYCHLDDILTKNMFSNYRKGGQVKTENKSSRVHIHEFLCEKLKMFGVNGSQSSVSVADLFRGISMPTSIYEVASGTLWNTLPMDVLELAFTKYAECLSVLVHHKQTSLDFLAVPDKTQLPPFLLRNPSHRSNKWSRKAKRGDDCVGPVLPLSACLALHEIQRHGQSHLEKVYNYSPDYELTLQCEAAMHAAKEVAILASGHNHCSNSTVSLGDDGEETWRGPHNSHSFLMYETTAFSNESLVEYDMEPDPVREDRRFTMIIAELPDEQAKGGNNVNGMNLFDDLCPVKLGFDTSDTNFDGGELKAYQLLKRQFSKWQAGFTSYQDLCSQIENQNKANVRLSTEA